MDTTVVYLEDYFADVNAVQKIEVPEFLSQQVSTDKKKVILIVKKEEVPFLSELKITTAQDTYSILLRKSKKEKITFSFDPKGKIYSKVSVVGDLTGWNPNAIFMENRNGIWQTELILNPGRYQYQIVADGNWFLDPNNPEKIDNGIGGFNSLMRVGEVDRSKLPRINANKTEYGNCVGLTIKGNCDKFYALWDNYNNIDTLYYNFDSCEECSCLLIPDVAKKLRRSFIRVFASNNYGESNDLLIPLEYGKVITDPALLEKDDLQKTIMYFMMVDRFNNGDIANDNPVKDDRVLPQANYYGGDLIGVLKKIDEGYFQSMGFNALWISPIFQNPYNAYQEYPEPHRWFSGYHGYWPISLSQVDTRFGNNLLFKNLVDDAHRNNMSVYLDYVANHIHEQHPLWKSNPEYFSNLNLPDGRKNLRLWDEQRLTTWFEPYMPSFDHSKHDVAELCADSAMYWLKEFNLDGFRHDATKHIETEFWRILTQKIKTEIEIPQQRNIYQIGETFGSRELIGSYLGSGLLNAQFDFNLYFDARSVFANDDVSFERLSSSLHETFDYYSWHHVMGNITGNHDMARFI
ncbi:MAG: alpha-amylase, partial [Fimbriimonadaceae bacterium]|nr:alpha-amylase [Chitinophagales bacterium]